VCVYHVPMVIHVIKDIFIPTLCSTAADIARDVASLRTVERAAANSHTHTHTHTYALAYQDIDDDGRGSRTEEKRTKLNIVLFFFLPFGFAFYIVIACALRTPIFVFYNTRRRCV